MGKKCPGNNHTNKFKSSTATLRLNKPLWLAIPSPMTIFNQSECFISAYCSYSTLIFVYDIGFRIRFESIWSNKLQILASFGSKMNHDPVQLARFENFKCYTLHLALKSLDHNKKVEIYIKNHSDAQRNIVDFLYLKALSNASGKTIHLHLAAKEKLLNLFCSANL